MGTNKKIQLNVRVDQEIAHKLDRIVEYYQKNTKYGTVYKGEVLTDLIEKAYESMQKQSKWMKNKNRSL
ncbi:hypothetical protein [Bacillus piscicola]|uniref:hypothetical protein n=1 Tax=Bacillus piscicola TaxID=1632684 RepID=UPI001F08D445|nr:hypothetical protein [Bacillus piscicola]